ncbi:MAG: hypothetical protein ACN4GZ_06130 [Acidimicrobiales bacterium]
MILDAGPLIATDRDRRALAILMKMARADGHTVRTTEAVVAQVWRNGASQANLASALKAIEVESFGDGKTVGELCAAAETSDVVDASLAILAARTHETLLTGDLPDFEVLRTHLDFDLRPW